MLPTAFLSFSNKDKEFAQLTQENLPDGLAYFFTRSFKHGEELVSAMEERIKAASIFVLLASHSSLSSDPVQFEIKCARLTKNKRKDFQILVFPIQDEFNYINLPEWLKEFWIPRAGFTPRDVARYIRNSILNTEPLRAQSIFYGRGDFIDSSVNKFQEMFLSTKNTPNVFIFAGNGGIGRRTVGNRFLEQVFPTLPEINYGPEFLLPQFADLPDMYRVLSQELSSQFSLRNFQDDLNIFNRFTIEERVEKIVQQLNYFANIDQAVKIVTGNGIYHDSGVLKDWVQILFKRFNEQRRLKLCIFTNRQIHENELRLHPNVLQFYVNPLQDSHIRTLMIATAQIFNSDPQVPDGVVRAVGGHPGIAKAATRLIMQKGATALDNDMRSLFSIQDEILGECLNINILSPIELDILSILSWVPQLNGQLLKEIILDRHQEKGHEFTESLSNLILSCLVLISGSNYLISAPIRGMFRRKHGYGSIELRTAFSKMLHNAWNVSAESDELKTELFDAIIYMIALEGGTLPEEFKGLMLPSTLQEIIRDTYNRGHNDNVAFNRVVTWGLPAKEMRMDETTREEILSYVLRAQVHLENYVEADKTLRFIYSKGYRSRFYLHSVYVKNSTGDLNEAILLLKKAFETKKYMKRVIVDLALCYQKTGQWLELRELLKTEEKYIYQNPILLDIKVGLHIARSEFKEAEDAIQYLRAIPYEDGRADSRVAMIMMKRDLDFRGAIQLLTEIIQRKTGGAIPVRRLRAIAATFANDLELARQEIHYLRSRPGGIDMAHRIEARIKLVQNDYDGASAELKKVEFKLMQDRLLEARILEARGNDINTPLSQRDNFLQQASVIRAQNRIIDELEFSG